jgi:hypothetical protein
MDEQLEQFLQDRGIARDIIEEMKDEKVLYIG